MLRIIALLALFLPEIALAQPGPIPPTTTGQLIGFQKFTTSGTYTPTAGMKSVIFEVQGGGAGGGGSTGASAGNVSLGAPGTSASYAKGLFTAATIGASQVVTIGGGSNGGAGIAATNGGTSSVGSLITAPGGVGGDQPVRLADVGPAAQQFTGQTGGNLRVADGCGERICSLFFGRTNHLSFSSQSICH